MLQAAAWLSSALWPFAILELGVIGAPGHEEVPDDSKAWMPHCLCLCPFSLNQPHAQALLKWGQALRRSQREGGDVCRTATHYLVPPDPTVAQLLGAPQEAAAQKSLDGK